MIDGIGALPMMVTDPIPPSGLASGVLTDGGNSGWRFAVVGGKRVKK